LPFTPTDILQLLLNGLMSGAILAAPAIGFTAIYAVLRFPNFAVASHATTGAFAGYVANATLHLPLLPSAIVAFLAAGIVGIGTDAVVLRPLRRSGLVTATIGSVALTVALVFVNLLPVNPYFDAVLADWRQGRYLHFNGLAHWLAWIWPYAALVWLAYVVEQAWLRRRVKRA